MRLVFIIFLTNSNLKYPNSDIHNVYCVKFSPALSSMLTSVLLYPIQLMRYTNYTSFLCQKANECGREIKKRCSHSVETFTRE